LHIDTSIDLVKALSQFLSKFHLIHTGIFPFEEGDTFAKSTNGKVVMFKSAKAYVNKLTGQPVPQPISETKADYVRPAVQMQLQS
jgi:hypothetical protein